MARSHGEGEGAFSRLEGTRENRRELGKRGEGKKTQRKLIREEKSSSATSAGGKRGLCNLGHWTLWH